MEGSVAGDAGGLGLVPQSLALAYGNGSHPLCSVAGGLDRGRVPGFRASCVKSPHIHCISNPRKMNLKQSRCTK